MKSAVADGIDVPSAAQLFDLRSNAFLKTLAVIQHECSPRREDSLPRVVRFDFHDSVKILQGFLPSQLPRVPFASRAERRRGVGVGLDGLGQFRKFLRRSLHRSDDTGGQ